MKCRNKPNKGLSIGDGLPVLKMTGQKGIKMRKAYFEDGSIIESTCGKAHFKRVVARHRDYCRTISGKRPRVWFRHCDEWQTACDKEWQELYKKIWNIG